MLTWYKLANEAAMKVRGSPLRRALLVCAQSSAQGCTGKALNLNPRSGGSGEAQALQKHTKVQSCGGARAPTGDVDGAGDRRGAKQTARAAVRHVQGPHPEGGGGACAAAAAHRSTFDDDDAQAVLTGVETRSSSPIRMTRGADFQSLNVRGLFPAGEGAGYAGGILSAAVDGIKVAEAVARSMVAKVAA